MAETLLMREALGKTLVELGREDPAVVVVDADLASSTRIVLFRDAFPERFFQAGVAEQDMIGIAAGLAYSGLVPFAATFSCFLKRAIDQIRVCVAQPGANVKIIGCYSGLCSGLSGKSHQTVQDIAIMRSMPNLRVAAPADNVEMAAMLRTAARTPGPFYIRLVRGPTPVIFPVTQSFEPEKAMTLRQGRDLILVSTGVQTVYALEAAALLKEQGIDAGVLHMPWIKPIDEKALVRAAKLAGTMVTVEEHTILGGLGSAVAEVLSEFCPTPLKRVGITDSYGQSGSYNDLLGKFGLLPPQIAATCREFLLNKSGRRSKLAPALKAKAPAASGQAVVPS